MKRKLYKYLVVFLFFLLLQSTAGAQNTCPLNIGFESGSFDRWQAYVGTIGVDGKINLTPSAPDPLRHRIYQNSSQQQVDFYGKFPVNCPNGSGYSIRLGNDFTDAQAEMVSYTFVIPSNQNDYSLIYNYAVVFQDPGHVAHLQPRFASRIFNVTDNKYVDCATFQFVASGELPDFFVSKENEEVVYKSWSPITINLFGYAGKTLRLEFTTNDCGARSHFGYAYIDVNENCSTPLKGNVLCVNKDVVTLNAPFGFKEYNWYNGDLSQRVGTGNQLKIFPAVPGTQYSVEIIPYEGLGCQDTLRTTIKLSGDPFVFKLADSVLGCASPGVDLTQNRVTMGSSAGMFFSYFTDTALSKLVPFPKQVKGGTYFIKGENNAGCTETAPVTVVANDVSLVIKDPDPVCEPGAVNITSSNITTGSEPGLSFTYWTDASATTQLSSPQAIKGKAMYYIKGTSALGCSIVKPVRVNINPPPSFTVENPPAVIYPSTVNLNQFVHKNGNAVLSFWRDQAASWILQKPEAVDSSGVYYVKATTSLGCAAVSPVQVTINPPIVVPNAFSPNHDGIHDVWSIPSLILYPDCVVELFDRYGQQVFRSVGYQKDWDGKNQKGQALPLGTYYYVIKLSSTIPSIGGSVTVLR